MFVDNDLIVTFFSSFVNTYGIILERLQCNQCKKDPERSAPDLV